MIVIDANKRKELSDIGYNCDFSDSIDSKYPNILEMTKVELHTHLLGSFNLEDLWELCKKYNKDTIYPEFIAHFGNYHNFDDFSKTRKYKNKLIHSYEDFSFLMDGYIQYLKKQHIVYVEPAIAMFELPPLKPERLIEIAHNKLKEGGIQFSFIMDLIRGDGPKELKKRYDFYHELSPEYNIRGVGLAGNERKYGLNPNLIPIFDEAKTDGYGISIHLGEKMLNVDYLLAVERFHANRLGHFHSAFSGFQLGGVKITKYLLRNNIHIETVPIMYGKGFSDDLEWHFNAEIYNKQGGSEDDNPARFSFSVNSDDVAMYNTSLSENLTMCISNDRVPTYLFRIITSDAIQASFASNEVKEKLRTILLNQFRD